ncbi:zeta toxin family protein [Streptomyces sp. NPDC056944]|uniref:zeta toxin family protein n=1 Tax=unclassified Streptomyces TaxID=2593676 RepID=UPI00362ABA84
MRPGTTRLVGDNLKIQHPDYYQLLRDDPRNAGATLRADYRAWFARAEQYVRDRRGDVLIEAAPGSVNEFLHSAMPYATGGYPVELVVLAVREADSRLSTVLRYARSLQLGGTGRFTRRSGHDKCFRALADVVAVAEQHPQIAAVTVIRRDGQAMLRHENRGAGAGVVGTCRRTPASLHRAGSRRVPPTPPRPAAGTPTAPCRTGRDRRARPAPDAASGAAGPA